MPNTLLAAAARSVTAPDSPMHRAIDRLPDTPTNVSSAERLVSLVLGGLISVKGFDGRGPSVLSTIAGGFLLYRAAAGTCPAYRAFGISTSESTARNTAVTAGHGARVDHAVTVNKPAAEAYRFWRDFENLPRFMAHLEDVDTTTDGRSRWIARGPLGLRVEWQAEIIEDRPGEVISWKSLPGSDVDTAGSVHFRELPAGHGTEVRVRLKYDPPAGKLGTAVARLFGEAPDHQVRDDLRRFKQVLETGEIPSVAGQPHGRR